jgi:hypothetical protein
MNAIIVKYKAIGNRFRYVASDGTLTKTARSKSAAVAGLRRARWEAREFAAGRYTVDAETGGITYLYDAKGGAR